jgi:hypothetical protein
MPRRVPDIGKISRYIGYRPTVHLDEIIEHVVTFWAGSVDQGPAAAIAPASARFASETTPVAVS